MKPKGWVALHRKILANPIVGSDVVAFYLFARCIIEASHRSHSTALGYQLKRGQLIVDVLGLANDLSLERGKVRRALTRLEEANMVKRVGQIRRVGTVLEVVNYDEYQSRDDALPGTPKGPFSSNTTTTASQSKSATTSDEPEKTSEVLPLSDLERSPDRPQPREGHKDDHTDDHKNDHLYNNGSYNNDLRTYGPDWPGHAFIDGWNERARQHGWPIVAQRTTQRCQKLDARMSEALWDTAALLDELDRLRPDWLAGFPGFSLDWLLQQESRGDGSGKPPPYVRILEGKFRVRPNPQRSPRVATRAMEPQGSATEAPRPSDHECPLLACNHRERQGDRDAMRAHLWTEHPEDAAALGIPRPTIADAKR